MLRTRTCRHDALPIYAESTCPCVEKVYLNIPGYKVYDLTKPWVYHLTSVIRHMGSLFTTNIYDIIIGYHSKKYFQDTSCQVTKGVKYLGQQYAAQSEGHLPNGLDLELVQCAFQMKYMVCI